MSRSGGGRRTNLGPWPNPPLRSASATTAKVPQKVRTWLDALSDDKRGRMPPEPSHVPKSKHDYKALLSTFLYEANDEARTKFFSDSAASLQSICLRASQCGLVSSSYWRVHRSPALGGFRGKRYCNTQGERCRQAQ